MNFSHTLFKRASIVAQMLIIALVSISAIKAQTGGVDSTFNAVVSKNTDVNGSPLSQRFTLQPDGKILVYGIFQVINGVIKKGIARFNPDGSLDNSFDCASCNTGVGGVIIQPDGKIIVSSGGIKRLNSDGSLDASFNSSLSDANGILALQPDGKIIVSKYTYVSGFSSYSIFRLNADGSVDNTFSRINLADGRTTFETIGKVVALPSGKLLITTGTCCSASFGSIRRYNSDGTLDSTFESPTFTGNFGFGNGFLLSDFEVFPDGSIVIAGSFLTVNGVDRKNVVKLQPAGNVDLSFTPAANVYDTAEYASGVEIFSNGRVLISTSGLGSQFPSETTNRFVRFNTDGSFDNTFVPPANLIKVSSFVIDSSDNVFFYGSFTEDNQLVYKYACLNMNGGLISSFVANVGIVGTVYAIAIQTDGKVIITGDFTQINGISRSKIARLNADGSLDTTFNVVSQNNDTIGKVFIQPDGKILLTGTFTINNVGNLGIKRLNADGSLNTSFNPIIDSVATALPLADGKILVGGGFVGVNGQTQFKRLVRLNADGTTDTSFNPIFGSGFVSVILLQSDGKIVVGGSFSGVNGFARTNLVRLNSDGSLDTSFNAGSIAGVKQIERQIDGKYIVIAGNVVVRLNVDGTTDNAFQSLTNNGTVNVILLQPDGTVIVGGNFTSFGGVSRAKLIRLKADGTLDTSFFPGGADNEVRAIVRQSDGKIIVGGSFTTIENVTRFGIARLNVASVRAPVTPYDYDGDGRADLAVFRPSNGSWYILGSQSNSFTGVQFGAAGDKIAPADYDGDGRTDIAVFRDNISTSSGSTAAFFILNSSDNSFRPAQFGSTGDIPISGDWDGDGIGDLAVYRDGSLTGGSSLFLYRPSSQPGADFRAIVWGAAGDKPVVGDYDGDGKLDAAVFRPSNSQWYILRSSNNQFFAVQFGQATDILTPADYNGDGVTDFGVFRPSNGTWYYSSSQTNPSVNFTGIQFGQSGDLPVPADYDGDRKADVAVFHPSNGIWYLNRSTQGFTGVQFGASGDKPAPNAYVR